jgi:hypothetical protein
VRKTILLTITGYFVLLAFLNNPTPALACTRGPGPELEELVLYSDYFVKGQVVQIDDAHENGILRIEMFFRGTLGPQYVLFQLNDTETIAGLLAGYYGSGDCGMLYGPLYPGDVIYAPLLRLGDGRYEILDRAYRRSSNTNDPEAIAAEADYVERLWQADGSTPNTKINDTLYPLVAPLLITTTNNTQYIFPVDRGALFKVGGNVPYLQTTLYGGYTEMEYPAYMLGSQSCFIDMCVAFSPNGLHWLQVEFSKGIKGTLFSHDNAAMATWTDTELTIEIFGNDGWGDGGAERKLTPKNAVLMAQHAVWSPDGRVFAYSDAAGLWMLDVYDLTSEPELVLPTPTDGKIPFARYITNSGNYLAITEGDKSIVLDVKMNKRYSDGLISPDERALLAFIDDQTFERCFFLTGACIGGENAKQIMWLDSKRFAVIRCDLPEKPCVFEGGA